jgi:alpha-tubulin suppressor-like RCC1 family protein
MRRSVSLSCILLLGASLQLISVAPAGAASARGMWVWGRNDAGALGNGTTASFPLPVRGPAPAGPFRVVSEGGSSSLGIAVNGTVWAWGDNMFGELGNGSTDDSTVPVEVSVPSGVEFVKVDSGGGSNLALDASGHAWAWGDNSGGELGNGTMTERHLPVRVHLPSGVTLRSISAGGYHSMALDSQGRVWQWGSLEGSQSLTPTRVIGWPNRPPTIVAVSAGSGFDLALSTSGKVYAWGNNDLGQLGDGSGNSSDTPVRVHTPASATLVKISAASYDGYAIDSTGRAFAWGNANAGQLGNGTYGPGSLPVRVSMPPGITFKAISGEAVALATDGSAWTWGYNGEGELGNGTFGDGAGETKPQPVHLPAGVHVTAVSGAGGSILALGTGSPPTDLILTHQGDFDRPPQVATETLGVGNSGAASADVTLTYNMPPHAMFLSADPSQGSCGATGDQVTCDLGSVDEAAVVHLQIRPLVLGTPTTSGSLSVSDSTPADNSFTSEYFVGALNNAWRYVELTDTGFDPDRLQVKLGGNLEWNVIGDTPNGVHDTTGLHLFDSGTLSPPDFFVYTFQYPGTYAVIDELGHSLSVKAPLSVRPNSGNSATTFYVDWRGAPSGDVADVQIAYCADPSCTPAFSLWRHGTTLASATFTSSDTFWKGAGTYFFRSRIRKAGTQVGPDWSPVHPITVTA